MWKSPCRGVLLARMEFAHPWAAEVRLDGSELPLGGPKQRAVLAVLLLARNEVVSRDRLVEALWGDRAPPTAQRSLDSYVSRLRRLLGADRLVRRAPGYALRVDPGELDLDRFEALVGGARAGVPRRQRRGRWAKRCRSGAARPWPISSTSRLPRSSRSDSRSAGWAPWRTESTPSSRWEAARTWLAELEALVRDHPFRERLFGQLMLALYRAGRQAEALGAYRDAQRRLATELGMEPGSQLRELEQRILQHDPSLDAPRRIPRGADRSPRRGLAAALVLLACAGVAVAVLLLTGSSSNPDGGPEATDRLVGIDVRSGNPASPIALTGPPAALTVDADSVWAADSDGETVARISPSSGAVVDRIPIAGQPGSLAAGGGAVWAASTLGGTIQRIDRDTGRVTQTVRLGADNVAAIAFGDGALWAADTTQRALVEIDPRTGSLGRTIKLDLRPTALVAGGGSIWVADQSSSSVEELDPATGSVRARVQTGNGPAALAVGAGAVWVANSVDSTVSKIDPRTGSVVVTLAVGSGPSAIAVTGGSVWVASTYSGEIARIDPRRDQVTDTVEVGGRPSALAAGAGALWVGAGADGVGHRGGTMRLISTSPLATIDPAFAYYGRAVSVRPARLRHAGHLRSLAGARWAQARSGPRAGHPVPIGRRDDLQLPSEGGNQVLKRPAAAGERLPPGDRTAVFERLAGRRLLPGHRGNRRMPRARGGL